MRKFLPFICMCVGVVTTPAHATGEFFCTGKSETNGGIQIDLSISRLEILHILNATISLGDKVWSTIEGDGVKPIAVGQAFGDGDRTVVDFMDTNYEGVIARLRVFQLSQDDDWAAGGVFSLKGEGAWSVSCEG